MIRIEPQSHDAAEELLPWYATGQLDEAERIRVEEHLSSCSGCREQLAFERRMIHEFRSRTPEVDAAWARLRTRIETAPIPPRHQPRSATRPRGLIRRPRLSARAAAQLAFLVVAGGVLLSLSRPTYHALGSGAAVPSANVLVIFRAGATVGDIRDALHASGATMVGGPTSADAYLLRVPQKQRQIALAKLKADNQVQMAEPVDGASQ